MAYPVTADPTTVFADAIKSVLSADATLGALVTGVYGHLSEAARGAFPYVVLGRTSVDGSAGAMQIGGNIVTMQVDAWSEAKGPFEVESIASRVYVLLERRSGFSVSGLTYIDGSLHREFGEVFFEPDEDKPESGLYRMTQRWTAEIHES